MPNIHEYLVVVLFHIVCTYLSGKNAPVADEIYRLPTNSLCKTTYQNLFQVYDLRAFLEQKSIINNDHKYTAFACGYFSDFYREWKFFENTFHFNDKMEMRSQEINNLDLHYDILINIAILEHIVGNEDSSNLNFINSLRYLHRKNREENKLCIIEGSTENYFKPLRSFIKTPLDRNVIDLCDKTATAKGTVEIANLPI